MGEDGLELFFKILQEGDPLPGSNGSRLLSTPHPSKCPWCLGQIWKKLPNIIQVARHSLVPNPGHTITTQHATTELMCPLYNRWWECSYPAGFSKTGTLVISIFKTLTWFLNPYVPQYLFILSSIGCLSLIIRFDACYTQNNALMSWNLIDQNNKYKRAFVMSWALFCLQHASNYMRLKWPI